jgi:hypothetical protein
MKAQQRGAEHNLILFAQIFLSFSTEVSLEKNLLKTIEVLLLLKTLETGSGASLTCCGRRCKLGRLG